MDTWVAAAFWLLWIMLLRTWMYKYFFETLLLFLGMHTYKWSCCTVWWFCFNFLRNHHTVVHRHCTILHSQQVQRFPFLHTLASACYLFIYFLTVAILMGVRWSYGLNLCFLMSNVVKCHFTYLLAFGYLFVKFLLKPFSQFWIGFFVFFFFFL